MKPIPRTFIRALAMMMFIVAGALTAAAQDRVKIGDLYYDLDETNHTAEVSTNYDQNSYENKVVIPESVTHNGNS